MRQEQTCASAQDLIVKKIIINKCKDKKKRMRGHETFLLKERERERERTRDRNI